MSKQKTELLESSQFEGDGRKSLEELIGERSSVRLLVSTSEGMRIHELPGSGQITLGRTPDNDIAIDDGSISRYHAVLHLEQPQTITDLGSTNGVRVRGNKLKPHEAVVVDIDEPIDLGNVLIALQQNADSLRPRRLCSHAYFEVRLEEEYLRVANKDTQFAILRLQVPKEISKDLITSLLESSLRPFDLVALYAPGEFEIMLPDVDAAQLKETVKSIRARFKDQNYTTRLGVALYPRDGRSPERLLAKACSEITGIDPAPKIQNTNVIVEDEKMQRIYRLIDRVAPGKLSVLLLGETGAGKEILAETVHRLSPRSGEKFLRLNCAALSETLLESELFGHEKGAFTGAVQAKKGLLESANKGTVFLDEIGEMPLTTQAKLLRVLEEGQVMRVGGLDTRKIDVRFVAATNRNLEDEIEAGRFRQDLYFRLNGIAFNIPPLRERPNEIFPLAQLFLTGAAKASNLSSPPNVSEEAKKLLLNYRWPGNIRELRNAIDRAILLCDGDVIEPEHLPEEKMRQMMNAPVPQKTPEPFEDEQTEQVAVARDTGSTKRIDFDGSLKEMERQRILDALEECGGNQTKAAALLGMPRRTFVKRLDAYKIARPRKNVPQNKN
tara:strand:- start:2842 stop:4674 length:1833 start_codon:yes stop_codon:yes gene_type:complete